MSQCVFLIEHYGNILMKTRIQIVQSNELQMYHSDSQAELPPSGTEK